MMGARSALRYPGRASVLALLLLVAAPAWSEVGVVLDQNPNPQQPHGPYALGVIVDDPGPIGTIWQQYSTDPSRAVLNPGGVANGDGPPAILRLPAEPSPVIAVAWSRSSPSGYDVVISRFENGAWSVPGVVAGGPGDELDPQLVAGPDGTVHLFYWRDTGSAQTVLYRQAPTDLSSWSAEEQVSNVGQPACRPSGAVHEGVLRVAYEIHEFGFEDTPRQIVLARREGTSFYEEVLSISQYNGDLWPEVHSHDGILWVDWIDSDLEAAWLRKDAQGYWEPTRYEPYTGVLERDYHVRNVIRSKALE